MKRFAAMLMVVGASSAWAQDVKPAEKEAAPSSVPGTGPAIGPAPAGVGKSPIEKAKNAVVRVRSSENKRPVAVGSGVIVSGDGLIVTCSNVVEDADAAEVQVAGSTEWVGVELVAMREAGGLAVLKVSIDELKKKGVAFGRVKVGEILPAEASEVWSLGFDGEGQYVVKKGIVNSVRPAAKLPERLREAEGFGDSKWVEMDCPVDEHGGGGPVLNGKGEVVGVKVWSLDGVPGDNFAVSGVDVAAFLEAKGTFKKAFAGAEGTGKGTQRVIEAARRVRDGWACTLCKGNKKVPSKKASKKLETCPICDGAGVALGEKIPRLLEQLGQRLADADLSGEEGKKAIEFTADVLKGLPVGSEGFRGVIRERGKGKLESKDLRVGTVVVCYASQESPRDISDKSKGYSCIVDGVSRAVLVENLRVDVSTRNTVVSYVCGTYTGTRIDSKNKEWIILENGFRLE